MKNTVWVRHLKRGSIYQVLRRDGEVQSKRPIEEGDKLVTYIGQDGRVWHRPPEEFDDGRFQQLEPHEIPACDDLENFVALIARMTTPADMTERRQAIAELRNLPLDEVTDDMVIDDHSPGEALDEAMVLWRLIYMARSILDKRTATERANSAGNALQASQSGSKSRAIF